MEKRRTIREYLDNPRLLSEISIETLQFWADEVPYAAIIHQLMAMKVVQEEHTSESRNILQKATLYSPNPDRLSRQLHKLAADATQSDISHTHPDIATQISASEVERVETAAASDLNEGIAAGLDNPTDIIEERLVNDRAVGKRSGDPSLMMEDQEVIKDTEETAVVGEDENELSEFSQWLLGLRKVAQADADDEVGSSILDGHQDISSETLAELLVQQGHTNRAIAMYEQLTLKYPKKSSFFAGQIQKIQGL